MGGCFPCFGSSNKEAKGLKEVVVKKDSLKEGSIAQSYHTNRVSSGQSKRNFHNPLISTKFDLWVALNYAIFCVFRAFLKTSLR